LTRIEQAAQVHSSTEDPEAKAQLLKSLIGVRSPEIAAMLFERAKKICIIWGSVTPNDASRVAAELLKEINPETFTQGMLALQMLTAHFISMSMSDKAAFEGTRHEYFLTEMQKLMRLYADQTDALTRAKRCGLQQP
jgi:hypothetical protein